MLKHGVLGLLSYGDMTGYEIMEVFRDSLAFFWNASTSQIYRELQGLERKGFASSRIEEQEGRPNRRVYSLTEAGREELSRWLSPTEADVCGDVQIRFPFLLRLFFMAEAQASEQEAYVQVLVALSERFITAMEDVPEIIGAYGSHEGNAGKSVFWMMTADFGIRYARMLHEWSQACKDQLDTLQEEK